LNDKLEKIIKKLSSEISIDDLNDPEINFTESELKEIENQKLNQIKIQIAKNYLNNDQWSLNLDNDDQNGGLNKNKNKNKNKKSDN